MHRETSERDFFVSIDQPGRAGRKEPHTMLDRFTHTERHPLIAGMPPRARRDQCASAPWGDVRPVAGTSARIGGLNEDSTKQQQRGRIGMRAA
jgi:hypothetical protein